MSKLAEMSGKLLILLGYLLCAVIAVGFWTTGRVVLSVVCIVLMLPGPALRLYRAWMDRRYGTDW